MQLLQKRTHSGQCVSEFLIFFSCNAILVATCTCTFIPSWNTKESTVWFQMKKKCSSCRLLLAVKKDRRYRFFSNFQKLLHVSCTLILLKQKQLISKRISIVQLCFTDLSNNLFKVCLMPIHCAVFMRDLRIFSFSFYLDCIFKNFICYQNMLHVIIIC